MVIGLRRSMWNRFQGDEQADGEIPEGKALRSGRYRESSTSPKRTLRSTDTLVVALAAEVVSVVWVSSRTRQSAANDSES